MKQKILRAYYYVLAMFTVASLFTACPPIQPVTPDASVEAGAPDAGYSESSPAPDFDSGSPAFQACTNLGLLRCKEADVNCFDTIDHVLSDRLRPFDINCVIFAKNKEQARLCPGIKCP